MVINTFFGNGRRGLRSTANQDFLLSVVPRRGGEEEGKEEKKLSKWHKQQKIQEKEEEKENKDKNRENFPL